MPNSTTWGAYPTPTSAEANNVPADLLALATALDAHTVLFATSQADRDSRFSALPAGGLVSCAALGLVWLKLDASTWRVVSSDTGWLTTGFAYPTAGWQSGAWSEYRIRNGVIGCRLSVARTGSAISSDTNGNLVDDTIATLPVAARPTSRPAVCQGYIGGAGCTILINPSGAVRLLDARPSLTISVGNEVAFGATWMEG